MGCFLTEGLMEIFKQFIEERYRNKHPGARLDVEFGPTYDDEVNKDATTQLREMIENAKQIYSGDIVCAQNVS